MNEMQRNKGELLSGMGEIHADPSRYSGFLMTPRLNPYPARLRRLS